MKRQSFNQGRSKIFFYALAIACILGVCFVIVQDVNVPTTHVSKNIEVALDK